MASGDGHCEQTGPSRGPAAGVGGTAAKAEGVPSLYSVRCRSVRCDRLFNLEGVPGQQLCAYLFREHRLYTTVQLLGELEAVRVVVGLPSPLSHVERLLEAVASAAIHFNKSGTRSF